MRRAGAAVSVVALLALTACGSTYTDVQRDGGVTPAQAEQVLMSIEGVSAAHYSTFEWYSDGEGGAFSSEGMDVILTIEVDAEHSIADPTEFLTFLAETVWSVNDHYPAGAVIIALTGGVSARFDWVPVAAEVFDNPDISYLGYIEHSGVREAVGAGVPIALSSSQYGARFGQWPSEPVPIPVGLLRDEPVAVQSVAAIGDVKMYEYSSTFVCQRVLFTRNLGDPGLYPGVVTVEYFGGGGASIGTVSVAFDALDYEPESDVADWCNDDRPVRATLTTESVDGFDDVTIDVEKN